MAFLFYIVTCHPEPVEGYTIVLYLMKLRQAQFDNNELYFPAFKKRSDTEVYAECHTELVEVRSRSTKRKQDSKDSGIRTMLSWKPWKSIVCNQKLNLLL